MKMFLVLPLFLLLVGCTMPVSYSKNMRAATIQATATVATKATLDEIPADKYDAAKKMTVEITSDIAKFLDTGKIGDLPVDAARDAVVKYMTGKGWAQYVPMVIAIFDIAAAQTVPVEKLGADNIAMIKLGLESSAISAETSKVEWRRPAARGANKYEPPNRVSLYRK
jgi:hypothetical protein